MNAFWTIFRFSLWRGRWTLLGWGMPLLILGVITAPFYDLVAENQAALLPIIQGLAPALKGFAGGAQAVELFTPEGFISLRYFAFQPVMLGIFGVVIGSGLLAADEERGVLDFVLAHPAGRGAVFCGRLAAAGMILVGILVLAWLGLWIGVQRTAGLDLAFPQLGLPFLPVFAVTALFIGLALAFSMVMPSRAAAAMGAGILLFGSYIITNLARGIPGLEIWARFSPLTYFQSDGLGGVDPARFFGLLGAAVLLVVAAWFGFRARDIRVAGDGGWKLPWKRG